jgi:hypothetical protein
LNKKKQQLIILNDRVKQLETEVAELNEALQVKRSLSMTGTIFLQM